MNNKKRKLQKVDPENLGADAIKVVTAYREAKKVKSRAEAKCIVYKLMYGNVKLKGE